MSPNPRTRGGVVGFIKGLLVFVLLIAVIVASFWVSFLLGKRILVPVKSIPERKFEVAAPVGQPTPAALKKLEEVMLEEEQRLDGEELETVKAGPEEVEAPKPVTRASAAAEKHYYKVQVGVYESKSNALAVADKLHASGFATYIKAVADGWRVQAGAFYRESQAKHLKSSLSAKGFESTVIYE